MSKMATTKPRKVCNKIQKNSNSKIFESRDSQIGCTHFIIIQSLHNLLCDFGVHTQCAHMQNGQKGKNRPTKSMKMCAIEVEINSNSCKFESSDLEIGCGC